jgi:hypothetical protein
MLFVDFRYHFLIPGIYNDVAFLGQQVGYCSAETTYADYTNGFGFT